MTKGNTSSIAQNLGSALMVIAAASLQGCGTSPVPISPETGAELKSAPVVHVVKYRSGGIIVMTPKSAVGSGLLASMTGSSELADASSLVRAYGLPDQADAVSGHLVEKLKAEGRLTNLRLEPAFLPGPYVEDTAHYRSKYPSGLVLELSVENARAGYGVMNWKTYTYGFHGRARLIRPSGGQILWSDYCGLGVFGDEAAKRQLDVSEFEGNNGKRFKEVYNYSNERCSRILADKLLGKAS